jgi:dTMP kinase
MKGKLIVLCGTDGSGKGTQAKILTEHLKKEGFKVEEADFPQYGKSFFSGLIQRYLNGEFGSADDVSPYLASLLYAEDRFEAKEQLIKWLSEGKIIISNRYVSDNKAHQGGKIQDKKKRDEYNKWLEELEYKKMGLPKEDLVIFLNVPYEIGQELVDKKGERAYVGGKKRDIHEADKEHLKNAYNTYVEMAKTEKNWVRIDCTTDGKILPVEEIAAMVYVVVKSRI